MWDTEGSGMVPLPNMVADSRDRICYWNSGLNPDSGRFSSPGALIWSPTIYSHQKTSYIVQDAFIAVARGILLVQWFLEVRQTTPANIIPITPPRKATSQRVGG